MSLRVLVVEAAAPIREVMQRYLEPRPCGAPDDQAAPRLSLGLAIARRLARSHGGALRSRALPAGRRSGFRWRLQQATGELLPVAMGEVVRLLGEALRVCLVTATQTEDQLVLQSAFGHLHQGVLALADKADLADLLIRLHSHDQCLEAMSDPAESELTRQVAARVLQLGGPGSEGPPIEALMAYPPLALHLRLCELEGLFRCKLADPDGYVKWPLRGPFWSSLRRLVAAWNACFPEHSQTCPPAPARQVPGIDAFLAHYRPSVTSEWQQHLTAFGFYTFWRGSASLVERIGFRPSHRTRLLTTLQRKSEQRLQALWRRMLEDVHAAALKVPNLALNQALLRLRKVVNRIECDASGDILFRDEAIASLDVLRQTFLCFYSFPDSLDALLAGHNWAQELSRQNVERWRSLPEEINRAAGELRLVKGQIGLLDKLNPFKQTPEKRKARFLSELQNSLARERRSLQEELLRELARNRPVLALYFRLGDVRQALRDVTVESYTHEDSTRYRLKGGEAVDKALQRWSAEFAEALGPPVGLCELLLQTESYLLPRGST